MPKPVDDFRKQLEALMGSSNGSDPTTKPLKHFSDKEMCKKLPLWIMSS